jgi:molybdopterin-guanine dinucleotide biosynthesis protein A
VAGVAGGGGLAAVAGILLTGGRSRRMGRDKARLVLGGSTLAERSALVLEAVAAPCVEVGPGASGLPATRESPVGAGPLAAIVAGWQALRSRGVRTPAIVLACDLPRVSTDVLEVISRWPDEGSVVPLVAGVAQPLCARWSPAALDLACVRVRSTAAVRWMAELDGTVLLPEASFGDLDVAGALRDADSPDDLIAMGLGPTLRP